MYGVTHGLRVRVAFPLILSALLALLLVVPGSTYVNRYSSDVIGFMDAAARTLSGQTPNVDYSIILGPLAVLPLGFGAWLGGYGLMFPIASVVALLIVLPLAIHSSNYLDRFTALLFLAFVLILVASPIVPGDSPRLVTFAMYYNRWGWAVVALVLVMALPTRQTRFEAPSLAACLFILTFLKITFAVVALAFVVAYAVLFPERRRRLALASVSFLACAVVFGLLWGGVPGYVADIENAIVQSGAVRGGLAPLVGIFLRNAPDFAFLGAVLALAYLRRTDWRYLLLAALMGASGIVLLNQTAQTANAMTVVPAALVAILAPAKERAGVADRAIFAALVFFLTINPAIAILWHARMATVAPEKELLGLVTTADSDLRPFEASYASGPMDPQVLAQLSDHGVPELDRFYLHTLRDGVEILRAHPGKVMTLDCANAFNAALGRSPTKGTVIFPFLYRTIGYEHHPSAESFLGDADLVMIPRFPINVESSKALLDIYGSYLARHYRVAAVDDYWTLMQRNDNRQAIT